MACNLSGLNTGRCHRLYILKYGEYNDAPTLGGGGGDTTELETCLSSVETALPHKTYQSTVVDLPGIVTLKADQSVLNALSASSINNEARSFLASASGLLQTMDTQLPLRMTTDDAAITVQLRIGDVAQCVSRDFRRHCTHG